MNAEISMDWIIGLFGVLVMAFFIGCTSCWPYKSEDSSRRRQPPPPPSPSLEVQYEYGFYPPNPHPEEATQHPVHMKPSTVPVSKDLPIYLQIVSDTDVKTEDKEKEENQTPRSAVNSIGKDSAHSDSLYHSYENVAVEAPPSQTPRSAINSDGKMSAHSDSLYHSYENVTVEAPPTGPESDLVYENM